MRISLSRAGLAVWFAAFCLHAQTASTRSYDAASIKKVDPSCAPTGNAPMQIAGGRILLSCITTHILIQMAYNELPGGQLHRIVRVTGGPSWMDSVRYTVEAKAAGANGPEMVGVLLQDMLKQRFHLQVHTEPKDTPVFLLTKGDHEPKLKAADSNACVVRDWSVFPPPRQDKPMPYCNNAMGHGSNAGRVMDFYSVDMPSFAVVLSGVAGREVVDKTGITGKFDIHLEFAREMDSSGPVMLNGVPSAPVNTDPTGAVSIFTALQRETGLKLTAGTAALDAIVVDHVEPPTEN